MVNSWAIDFVGFAVIILVVMSSAFALSGARGPVRADRATVVAVFLAVGVLTCGFLQGTAFTISDSAEYLALARRLLFDGRLDLLVDNQNIPSRYQPWFSWFFIYPFLRLGVPSAFLNGISGLFACVGILAAGALARELLPLPLVKHSIVVGCGLLLVPAFGYFAGELMTDIPATVLLLLVALIFVREGPQVSPVGLSSAGLLVGAASALRPLHATVLVPWLWNVAREEGSMWRRIVRIGLVIFPTVLIQCASLYLNLRVFGDPWRSGYNLWTGVPYDFPLKVFNLSYLAENLTVLTRDPAFVFVFVGAMFPLRILKSQFEIAGEPLARMAFFIVCGIVPLVVIHLLYFYQSIRFFLPFECLLLLLTLIKITALAPRIVVPLVLCLLSTTAVKSVRVARHNAPFEIGSVERVVSGCVPQDGVIISSLHPMLSQEFFLRGTSRVLLPTSRSVELASKLLTWKKVPSPSGNDFTPSEHRAAWLVEGGAVEAYRAVAVDNPEWVRVLINKGRRVFLLNSAVTESERGMLLSNFTVTPVCSSLDELTVR